MLLNYLLRSMETDNQTTIFDKSLFSYEHLAGFLGTTAYLYASVQKDEEKLLTVKVNIEVRHQSKDLLEFYQVCTGAGIVCQTNDSGCSRYRWSISDMNQILQLIENIKPFLSLKKYRFLALSKIISIYLKLDLSLFTGPKEFQYSGISALFDKFENIAKHADTILALNPRTKKDSHTNMEFMKALTMEKNVELKQGGYALMIPGKAEHIPSFMEPYKNNQVTSKYLAGLFDAHGSFVLTKKEDNKFVVSLEMMVFTTPDSTYLAEAFKKYGNRGYIAEAKTSKGNESWKLIKIEDIHLVLKDILPFLLAQKR